MYILGENTSKYFSRIIVVHVHATVVSFSKVHPACHNIVNSIEPGSDSKKTDKHAVGCSKTYLAALSDLSEMYKLFIQQCGQRYPCP